MSFRLCPDSASFYLYGDNCQEFIVVALTELLKNVSRRWCYPIRIPLCYDRIEAAHDGNLISLCVVELLFLRLSAVLLELKYTTAVKNVYFFFVGDNFFSLSVQHVGNIF